MPNSFLDMVHDLSGKDEIKCIKAKNAEAKRLFSALQGIAIIADNVHNVKGESVFNPGSVFLDALNNENDPKNMKKDRSKFLNRFNSSSQSDESTEYKFLYEEGHKSTIGFNIKIDSQNYIIFSTILSNWVFIFFRYLEWAADKCNEIADESFKAKISVLKKSFLEEHKGQQNETITVINPNSIKINNIHNLLSVFLDASSGFITDNFNSWISKKYPSVKIKNELTSQYENTFVEICKVLFEYGKDKNDHSLFMTSQQDFTGLDFNENTAWILFEEPIGSTPNGTGFPPTPKSLNQYYYSNVFLFLEKSSKNAVQANKLMQVHLYQKLNAKLSGLELQQFCKTLFGSDAKIDTISKLTGNNATNENSEAWLALTSVLFKLSIRLSRAIAMKGVALADGSVANAIFKMQQDIGGAPQETDLVKKILTGFFNQYFGSLVVEQSVTKSESVDVSMCNLNGVNKLHIALEFGTSRIAKKTLKVECLNNNEYCELNECEPSAEKNSIINSEAFLRFDGELTNPELCRGSECLQKLSVNAEQSIDSTMFKDKFYTVNLEAIDATKIRIEADVTKYGSNNQKISHRRELQAAYKKTLLSLIKETSTFLSEGDNQAGVLSKFNERSNLLLTSPYSSKGSENTMIYRYLIDGPFLQKQSRLFESAYQKIETQLLNKLREALICSQVREH